MIDWNIARTLATTVAGSAPAPALDGLADAARESEELVSAYTGLSSDAPLPEPEALSRPAWIEANLESMKDVLDPVVERAGESLGPLRGPAGGVVGLLLAAEIGVISGLLAQRVLGQYEFGLLAPEPTRAALAAFALPTFQRSASALIDWFTLLFFSGCALVIWVIWISLQTGFPAKPAANVFKLAPGFTPSFGLVPFLAALVATLAWIALVRWRTKRSRHAIWKSLVLPAAGAALGWLLCDQLPARATWAGAPIIVGSGLVIVWRERVRRLRETERAVP